MNVRKKNYLNSCSIFLPEWEFCQGHVVQDNVEVTGTVRQLLADQHGNLKCQRTWFINTKLIVLLSISLKILESKKQFLRQSSTVLWFVLGSHMIRLTNKNTVLPRARKHFLRQGNTGLEFVLSSHMVSLTNENTVLLWLRNCFLAL